MTEEYRVITYDLEGHGQSPWGPLAEGERRVDKWARQLEEILDHVGVVETYIAAHSVGCVSRCVMGSAGDLGFELMVG